VSVLFSELFVFVSVFTSVDECVARMRDIQCLVYCIVACLVLILCLFDGCNEEPIRIPSATLPVSDDVEDGVSPLPVMRNHGNGSSSSNSVTSQQNAASAAASVGSVSMKTALTDTADNLHQLSLYVLFAAKYTGLSSCYSWKRD